MRLLIEFSYLGKNYSGYQVQPSGMTVQGELQHWLSEFFGCNIEVVASGRTDAGVSAIRQIAHFDIADDVITNVLGDKCDARSLQSVAIRVNYLLPEDIRILGISNVDDSFHARFIPKAKTYCYNFYLSKVEIPYLSQIALWLKHSTLDIDAMAAALKKLEGEQDFSSFCASNTDVIDKVRTIIGTSITRSELGFYTISITGTGFLYNMVRIIVGTIIDVGLGKKTISDIQAILAAKDRTKASKTAPACGLVLREVNIE